MKPFCKKCEKWIYSDRVDYKILKSSRIGGFSFVEEMEETHMGCGGAVTYDYRPAEVALSR